MAGQGTKETLEGVFAHPVVTTTLGVLGFAGALLSALADTTAGAVAAAITLGLVTFIAVASIRANNAFDGPYRVLESETIWELEGPRGERAVATKRQVVQFNFSSYIVEDTAYSDTGEDPFVAYTTQHGEKLGHTLNFGSERIAIVALKHQYRRGERETLVSERVLENQFPKASGEWIEIKQSQKGKTALTIFFPADNQVSNLTLWRSRNQKTEPLEAIVETGRQVVRLPKQTLRDGERLLVRWDW